MRVATNIARWVVRLTGLAQIVLGLVFWSGHAVALIPLHMAVGGLFTLGLLVLAGLAIGARVRPGLGALGVAWVILLPALGMGQMSLLPGAAHWIVRVLHLVVGLAAMGIADRLARPLLASGARGADAVASQPAA
ncbi:MAG TPA: hypothetical protein VFQ38_10245 [Longimicrobiales bacterium]|nr:hypothetical protein [Longimicrobiales bacterium]